MCSSFRKGSGDDLKQYQMLPSQVQADDGVFRGVQPAHVTLISAGCQPVLNICSIFMTSQESYQVALGPNFKLSTCEIRPLK